ncbi:hypothetical protein HDU76_005027 [Blyttiomyces sp. JEL0837]|nr:hypothetical protein HDU76_005027 [Blyttiomyces sp. JEL0837]
MISRRPTTPGFAINEQVGVNVISSKKTPVKVKLPQGLRPSQPPPPAATYQKEHASFGWSDDPIPAAINSPPIAIRIPNSNPRPASPASTASWSSVTYVREPDSKRSSMNSTLAYSRSPVPASLPPPSPLPVEPDFEKLEIQANDRALRKIMDLEIANESLLAVNTTLENTIREQAFTMEQLRRQLRMIQRRVSLGLSEGSFSLPDSIAGDYGLDHFDEEEEEHVDEFQMFHTNTGDGSRTKAEVPSKLVDEQMLEEDPIDPAELEIQFNRVCAMLNLMIQDCTKAVSAEAKRIVFEGRRDLIKIFLIVILFLAKLIEFDLQYGEPARVEEAKEYEKLEIIARPESVTRMRTNNKKPATITPKKSFSGKPSSAGPGKNTTSPTKPQSVQSSSNNTTQSTINTPRRAAAMSNTNTNNTNTNITRRLQQRPPLARSNSTPSIPATQTQSNLASQSASVMGPGTSTSQAELPSVRRIRTGVTRRGPGMDSKEQSSVANITVNVNVTKVSRTGSGHSISTNIASSPGARTRTPTPTPATPTAASAPRSRKSSLPATGSVCTSPSVVSPPVTVLSNGQVAERVSSPDLCDPERVILQRPMYRAEFIQGVQDGFIGDISTAHPEVKMSVNRR